MRGWVKLHRQMLNSPIFDNPHLMKMWMWCLLKASHKDHECLVGLDTIELKAGEFVTGRNKGSSELNVNPSTWYKHLKALEKLSMVELKSNNKMTVVNVVNWTLYQGSETDKEQQNNNKVTTKEQQSNTNKNDKNDKNDKTNIVVDAFKEKLHLLPQPRKITTKRREHIDARVKEYGLDTVLDALDKVEQSDFLMGKVKDFKADIDWIFNVNNFVKIVEGKYNSEGGSKAKNIGLMDYESPLGEREEEW